MNGPIKKNSLAFVLVVVLIPGMVVAADAIASGVKLRNDVDRTTTTSLSSKPVSFGEKEQSTPTLPEDFETRCHDPGVLVCQGFDSSEVAEPAKWPGAGLYPAEDGSIPGIIDSTVKASGNGSLRFEIPSRSGSNGAGYWKQPFGKNFGEGSTFYVQFRQRFSKEMLKNDWGDTTWKQVIFHNGSATCADVELTTVQYYHDGFPTMYTNCGSRSLFTNGGKPPTQLEQGDFNCWYGKFDSKSCFMYPADTWITFYYEVS